MVAIVQGRHQSRLIDAGMHWIHRAACRGADWEVFFPSSSGRIGQAAAMPAARLCGSCPVAHECATHAQTFPESMRYGVWGGYLWCDSGRVVDILYVAGLTPSPRALPRGRRSASSMAVQPMVEVTL